MHWAKGGKGTKELANHVVELKKKILNYYILIKLFEVELILILYF